MKYMAYCRKSTDEKDSIEKVRQFVVRIVGGEGEGSGFAIKPHLTFG